MVDVLAFSNMIKTQSFCKILSVMLLPIFAVSDESI